MGSPRQKRVWVPTQVMYDIVMYMTVDQRQGFSLSTDAEILDQADADVGLESDIGVTRQSEDYVNEHFSHLFKCDVCNLRCETRTTFLRHLQRKHNNEDAA